MTQPIRAPLTATLGDATLVAKGTVTIRDDYELIRKMMPKLADYISSPNVNAEVRSFRRFVIYEEEDGYRRERAAIVIKDGRVVWPDGFAPPAKEAKAIDREVAKAKLPNSIATSMGHVTNLREKIIGGKPELFVFLRQHGKDGRDVDFVQQRKYNKAGKKFDLPWSFWSDGKWRMIEPDHVADGHLPLFGLDRLSNGGPVMIHEGAKTAAYVQRLVTDETLSHHPWWSELRRYEHLGWPGGAPNSHRPDWSPLRGLAEDRRVVLVCDKDQGGVEASTAISRQLKRQMSVVVFGDEFPEHFDLADEWPKHPQWWRGKRYIGPTIDSLLTPATWATEEIETGKQGRSPLRVRKQFAAEWFAVTSPSVFVHRKQPDKLLTTETFNRKVRPYSDAEDTARLLAQGRFSQVSGIAYMPGAGQGAVVYDGNLAVNTFRPSEIMPEKGDDRPWQDFMRHLIPDEEDRHKLMRWCATLVCRPDVRMRYSPLLISEMQGVGKGTLGEATLSPLVGPWNCSFPSESEIVDSAFNSWIAHKRLGVIHELYSGHSRKGYDKLKSPITDDKVTVRRLYMEGYVIDNFFHAYACSNSMLALHLDDEDRRWLVPRVTESLQEVSEWRNYYAWLSADGLGIIRRSMEEFIAKHGPVETGDHAPTTSIKGEIISESRSEGMQIAYKLAELAAAKSEKCILAVENVRLFVAHRRGMDIDDKRLEKPITLRKAMRAAGLKDPLSRPPGGKPRFTITIRHSALQAEVIFSHVMANFVIDELASWEDLREHFRTAEELWPM